VNARGDLVGIVTPFDVLGRPDLEDGRVVGVGDVAVRNLVTARPGESLGAAVRRMTRLNLRQLPVVPGPLPAPPLGILRRSDVLAAYGRTLVRQSDAGAASGAESVGQHVPADA
jgi:predicted transcriptional regulator